ncbi:MAG: FtsX-like permease family protein [Candidatus Hydrogenedens sp.]|nr:FtsX-like permease family protein [Candidatus Hydrogenedens sp.]
MHPLHWKIIRTLRQNWGQSLAVMAVVLCGTACYICVYSAFLNLRLTRDTYYSEYRFADFEIMLERAPETAVFQVESMPGVSRARGRIVRDGSVDIEGIDEPRSGRVISMPVPRGAAINDIVVNQGRYLEPGAQQEVVLSERFATANGLEPGDWISVTLESKKYPLKIVGTGQSPEYIYLIRNVQELLPAPERFGVLWVSEEFAETAMNMSAACNNIVGLMDDPEQTDVLFDQIEKAFSNYGVFAKVKKEDQLSNSFITDEIKGLQATATVIPTVFLGIAAMILFVLLGRMVRMERTQIGLLKAFGYTDLAIAWHYIEYGLALCLAGCAGGFFLGQFLSRQLIKLYVEIYSFPLLESRVYPEVLWRSMGITIAFTLCGAVFAARQAAGIQPAEAMRPEAPRSGAKLLLERFAALWRRIPFSWKMTLRNAKRNRFRAAIHVAGVAVSTGLLMMGMFTMDSMDYMLAFQYENVQRENVRVGFQREQGKDTLYDLQRFDHVRRAEPLMEYPFRATSGHRTKDIVLTGLDTGSELRKLIDTGGREVHVDGPGVILSDKLAQQLQVQPGDTLRLEPLMGRVEGERTAIVSRISQQYLGAGAYMEIGALSRLLNEPYAFNAALLRTDAGSDSGLKKRLKDIAAVDSVGFSKEAYQALRETLASNMRVMSTMTLIFAGVIAFAIIYNLTSVSLAERQRELASLRVLGLTTAEVGRILYNESTLLSLGGIVFGIPAGIALCAMMVNAYDTELYRLPFHIDRESYALAVLLSIVFVVLANLATWRRLNRLDLMAVLKERE